MARLVQRSRVEHEVSLYLLREVVELLIFVGIFYIDEGLVTANYAAFREQRQHLLSDGELLVGALDIQALRLQLFRQAEFHGTELRELLVQL